MKFGHNDGSGGFILHPCWQMHSATPTQDLERPPYEWEKEFWNNAFKFRGESPMPIMVKDEPLWRGAYPRLHEIEAHEDVIFVSDFDLTMKKVKPRDVRLPNDAEYKKYFKRHVDSGTFRLLRLEGSEGYKLIRRHGGGVPA